MIHCKKIVAVLIAFCMMYANGFSQSNINYPVNITPVIYPPYPSSVQFMSGASLPNIYLTITNKSSNASVLNVQLGVSIKTNTFIAQTKPGIFSAPITLIGNSPTRISNLDFSSLYNFTNLTGITFAQYQTVFPQSTIVFSFVLYDAVTKRQVSQIAEYSVTYTVNSPPVTSAPVDRSVQVEQGIQNLLFQWQPRQATSSSGVQYILQIVQLLNATQDPQTAFFNTNNIFFTDSTIQTNYFYTTKNPPLLTNKTYAWRVQAKPIDNGGFTSTTFTNNGYSNAATFVYTALCKQPTQVLADISDKNGAKITWTSFADNQTFDVSYRKKGDQSWKDINGAGAGKNSEIIKGLLPNTNYEVQVKGVCYAGVTAVSSIINFKTIDADSIARIAAVEALKNQIIKAVCGQAPPTKNIVNDLLVVLKENDVIKAGDYSILVGSGVSGGGGTFSGSGTVDVWLANHVFKTKVSFSQVKVNKNYEIIDGAVNLSNK